MIDRRAAEVQRVRIQRTARDLGPEDVLWFEVRSARHERWGSRWRAAVCRPDQVRKVFAGASGEGATFELDYPSQLPEWLESLGLQPAQPIPRDWKDLLFFGCDVHLSNR